MTSGNNTQNANNSIDIEQITTTNVGRFQYQDGEVILFQNQLKPSYFFFTPFPHIEPNLTDCNYNDLSGYTELTLMVSLYTTNLLESIKHHVKKQHDICHTKHCEVSLLPIRFIRLTQKGLRTSASKEKYTLDSEWHSNIQLRQTIDFIIYTSNRSICESLKNAIISYCRLSNFEIQYSLHGQQTVDRTLEVTTEHVTKTLMYNQIKSRFPSDHQDTIALTRDDYKNLLNETMEQITINLQVEEGCEGIQDPVEINRLLDCQLQYKQVQLTTINDRLWESLYWTPELTRPDRLSKFLNKVMKQDAMDSNKFRYDYSQANETLKENLELHDRQNLDKLEKHLTRQYQNIRRKTNVNMNYKANMRLKRLFGLIKEAEENEAGANVHKNQTNGENSLNDDLIRYKVDTGRFNGMNNRTENGTKIILERKDVEKLLRYLSKHVELKDNIIKPKSIDVTLVKVGSLKSRAKLFSTSVLVKTRMNIYVVPLRCPYEHRFYSLAKGWLAEKYDRLSHAIDELRNKLTIDFNQKLIAIETRLMEKIEQSTNATINQMVNRFHPRLTGFLSLSNIPF
ncbi:unnamed protein product [Rotaria sp. Silwood2]|nr:unnamed protein product [Rotaria sp. Silwood2]CAF4143996.1 unnamed protein product [Rotaria sp. Silwood2]